MKIIRDKKEFTLTNTFPICRYSIVRQIGKVLIKQSKILSLLLVSIRYSVNN